MDEKMRAGLEQRTPNGMAAGGIKNAAGDIFVTAVFFMLPAGRKNYLKIRYEK